MNFSKFVLASDGQHAGVLLDGVFIGQGIQRLDFSAEEKNGKMRSTIRIMDLDVGTVSLERGDEKFSEFLEGMTKSPRFWGGLQKRRCAAQRMTRHGTTERRREC